MKQTKQTVTLEGSLWFSKDQDRFLGGDRIALLEKIGKLGSITQAAKAVGVSYKTAWEIVNQINNLAAEPLVDRTTGGKGGGGASLTTAGREVIERFRIVQEEHRKFLKSLDERLGDTGSLCQFLRRISMKVSARNIFNGIVASIVKGAVNAEVQLELKGEATITAVVTNGAIENLGLKEGMEAYAIIKASSVVIGTELAGAKLSTRNILTGSIVKLVEGPVSCEIDIELPGGNTISAVITDGSAKRMQLKTGDIATALFKASSVILGVN
jgi:molybdate transport system regulatory protein